MNRLNDLLGKEATLIAVSVAIILAGCGTSQRQQPAAAASVALTPEAAQQARAEPLVTHPRTSSPAASAAASTKQNTATVLSQIHRANLTEIALGTLAEEKASTDGVRAYAVQLIEDHTNVDRTVNAMAAKSGVKLQNGVKAHQAARRQSGEENQQERKMKSASGPAFDRLFLQETRSDHERLIRKLKQYREDASDDDLEALIDEVIPILQQDQELAEVLSKKEKA
jgi:predicted outer membrane protein